MNTLLLKTLIKHHGVTQSQLAKSMGLTQGEITQFLNYGKRPKWLARDDIQKQIKGYLVENTTADALLIDQGFLQLTQRAAALNHRI